MTNLSRIRTSGPTKPAKATKAAKAVKAAEAPFWNHHEDPHEESVSRIRIIENPVVPLDGPPSFEDGAFDLGESGGG